MHALWRNVPAYRQIAAIWPQQALAYRFDIIASVVGVILRVFLTTVVFRAVYAGRPTVDGVALSQLVTFVTLAGLQSMLVISMLPHHLRERVRDGSIVFDLGRPVPFLGQLMAHQLGNTAAFVPVLLATVPFALLVGGIEPPPSLVAGLLYIVSLVLGYAIAVLLGMILGLVCFWTTEIGGFLTIYHFVNHFFSGQLVPLWFFPPFLRGAANLLPFQAQTFIPISIYSGNVSGGDVFAALGVQVLWIVVLGAAAALLWRRAMHRVNVQGG